MLTLSSINHYTKEFPIYQKPQSTKNEKSVVFPASTAEPLLSLSQPLLNDQAFLDAHSLSCSNTSEGHESEGHSTPDGTPSSGSRFTLCNIHSCIRRQAVGHIAETTASSTGSNCRSCSEPNLSSEHLAFINPIMKDWTTEDAELIGETILRSLAVDEKSRHLHSITRKLRHTFVDFIENEQLIRSSGVHNPELPSERDSSFFCTPPHHRQYRGRSGNEATSIYARQQAATLVSNIYRSFPSNKLSINCTAATTNNLLGIPFSIVKTQDSGKVPRHVCWSIDTLPPCVPPSRLSIRHTNRSSRP